MARNSIFNASFFVFLVIALLVTGGCERAATDDMSWESHQERGGKRAAANDLKGAQEEYTAALKKSPPNPALYFLRGSVRLQMKDFDGAAEDFETGLKLDPGNGPLKVLLSQARAGKAGVLVQSDFASGAGKAADGMSWESHQERGGKRAAANDLKGAQEEYTAALKKSPPNPALYFLRGSVRLQMKDFDGAAEDFETGLKLDPGNGPLKVLLSQARAGKAGVAAERK